MAKAIKEYFSHDYYALHDEKIGRLIYHFGMLGYGIYWAIVERLYINKNVLRLEYERIGHDLKVEAETVKKIINDYDLFKIKGEIFFSESIKARLKERQIKSVNARKSISYRWNKDDTNVLQTNNDSNTIKEKNSIVKNNNIKKEIDKEKKFSPPDLENVKNYFLEKKSTEFEAQKFFNFYGSKNWMVGKNKMKKWELAASGWILRNLVQVSEKKSDSKKSIFDVDQNLESAKQNLLKRLNQENEHSTALPALEVGAV